LYPLYQSLAFGRKDAQNAQKDFVVLALFAPFCGNVQLIPALSLIFSDLWLSSATSLGSAFFWLRFRETFNTTYAIFYVVIPS